jgi:hypothetical protein
MRTVLVGVLTYRRPGELAEMLPVVLAQVDALPAGVRGEVLVVDNDPAGSARAVATSAGHPALRYVVEPTPGIAAGRNRVLTESAGRDTVVFVDDDEVPGEGWLAHLLDTQQRTGADVVAGTVVSDLGPDPGAWLRAGAFARRRLPTGTLLDVAATNNLLVQADVLRRTGVRFDPAFGLTGGEDTMFTRQLRAAGARMVWCAEAVVTDRVPPGRRSARWVLQRAYSAGNTVTRVDLALAGSARARRTARVRGTGAGVLRVAGGAVRWLAGLLTRSLDRRVQGARTTARGLGMAAGALGSSYQEYRRPG